MKNPVSRDGGRRPLFSFAQNTKEVLVFASFILLRSVSAALDAALILLLGALTTVFQQIPISDFSPLLARTIGLFGAREGLVLGLMLAVGSIGKGAIVVINAFLEDLHYGKMEARASQQTNNELWGHLENHSTSQIEMLAYKVLEGARIVFFTIPTTLLSIFANAFVLILVGVVVMASNPLAITMSLFVGAMLLLGAQIFIGRNVSKVASNLTELRIKLSSLTLSFYQALFEHASPVFWNKRGETISQMKLKIIRERAKLSLFTGLPAQVFQTVSILLVVVVVASPSSGTNQSLGGLAVLAAGVVRLVAALGPLNDGINELRSNLAALPLRGPAITLSSSIPSALTAHSINPLPLKVENPSVTLTQKLSLHFNIGFTVEAGNIYRLDAPSGYGKTTLLRAMAGLLPSDGIRPVLNNDENTYRQLRASISYIGSDPAIVEGTLADQLNLRESMKWGSIVEVLDSVSLWDELGDTLSLKKMSTKFGPHHVNLSTGQRARLAIARHLLSGNKLLILDETLSSLDKESRKQASEAVAGSDSSALIYVSHFGSIFDDETCVSLQKGK